MHDALEILRRSSANATWGYGEKGPAAAEPAAWTVLALASNESAELAEKSALWLQEIQGSDGSVGVTAAEQRPAWPTSLAILAWTYINRVDSRSQFQGAANNAAAWSLSTQGKTAERQNEIGHDPSLRGWAWAEGTHSWLEPTAMFVMALKAAGYWGHPRTREGVRLLVDRLLPEGGCNYGNTMVLGQTLLPHVQPTGLAMLALAGESLNDPRIGKSLEFLERSIGVDSSIASLSFALMGLAAHSWRTPQADRLIAAASKHMTSCYHAALLVLAASDEQDWLQPAAKAEEVVAS